MKNKVLTALALAVTVAVGAFAGYTSKKKMDVMTEDVAMRTAQVTKNPKINQEWVNHQWENVGF